MLFERHEAARPLTEWDKNEPVHKFMWRSCLTYLVCKLPLFFAGPDRVKVSWPEPECDQYGGLLPGPRHQPHEAQPQAAQQQYHQSQDGHRDLKDDFGFYFFSMIWYFYTKLLSLLFYSEAVSKDTLVELGQNDFFLLKFSGFLFFIENYFLFLAKCVNILKI